MNSLKVSIIIPTYNREELLPHAINSALNQTYQNIEIIVVNDASTDNTETVIHSFKDTRIRYIRHEKNQMLAASRNSGVAVACGEFVCFLDDDDIMEPDMISSCIDEIISKNADIVHVGFLYFTAEKPPNISASDVYNPPLVNFQKMLTQNFWPVNSVLIRKDLLTKAGKADTQLKTCEDWDLWLRILYLKPTISYVNRYLVRIRLHQSNMSRNRYPMFLGHYKILTKWQKILSESEKKKNKINFHITLESYKVALYGIVEDPRQKSFFKGILLKSFSIYPPFFLITATLYIVTFLPINFLHHITFTIEKILQKRSIYQQ